LLYNSLWLLFRLATNAFYASLDVRGGENVPKRGMPTLLCFNHGNSLGDAAVLISRTPRVIRFCAKDTVWKLPFFSYMIRLSGAIPIYRKREHGEKAKAFNVESFNCVYKALEGGDCIGFAPEGVSSFRSSATKFKNGVAHIAIEAVSQQVERGNHDFCVHVQPASIAWTHREKFRSDIVLRFSPPFVVNQAYINSFPSKRDAAHSLTNDMEAEFHENIISAPDFNFIRLAITATRIHRPLGTYMTLSSYMFFLRGWTCILQLEQVIPLVEGEIGEVITIEMLRDALHNYQDLLDAAKVRDERIRRIQRSGGVRPTTGLCIRIILYRAVICLILLIVALPGILTWVPVWLLIRSRERELVGRGVGWVDSIAENKMMIAFVFIVIAMFVANTYAPLLIGYFWLTMRLYEEVVASVRSICGMYRLMMISNTDLQRIIDTRVKLTPIINRAVGLFPVETAARIMNDEKDNVFDDKSESDAIHPRWWTCFNPLRRRKKDWNELLRVTDYCTMDYAR